MTDPQWLTTCFRNTWRKHKHGIWIDIIFPCLLAIFLAGSFIWIVWLVFEKYKVEEWAKAKYACVPAAIVVVVWILAKSVMGVLKPVSTQLMNYISFPDHADKLGYQDRVISDINFLKDEIGKKPSWICTAMVKLWYFMVIVWHLDPMLKLSYFPRCLEKSRTNMKFPQPESSEAETGRKPSKLKHLFNALKLWFAVLSLSHKFLGKSGANMNFPPAPSKDLRIIVFVDDLDRCQESVILEVLAAINLVLAVCEINVILGMDKELIESAITKKHGASNATYSQSSKALAEKYLQKIIQLPLDLPDPSDSQWTRFLESEMGRKATVPDGKTSTEPDNGGTSTHGVRDTEEGTRARETLPKPGAPNTSDGQNTDKTDGKRSTEPDIGGTSTHGTEGATSSTNASLTIDVDTQSGAREMGTEEGSTAGETLPKSGAQNTSDGQNTDKTDRCSCGTILQSITGTKGIKKKPPKQEAASTSDGKKTGNKPLPITEMLFVTYSPREWDAICHFKKFVTDCRRLPREWKRFLNYHRLVWNIFSINVVEKPLVGWQVQLISWIFICWEWKDNMDILIQDWLNVGVLKSLKSEEPSLKSEEPSLAIIVDHYIEKCGSKNEDKKGKPEENAETSKDSTMTQTTPQGSTAQTEEDPQEKKSRLDQSVVEMKEEMRAMKEEMRAMKEQLRSLQEFMKSKQVTPKNENRMDGNKIKQKHMPNWKRLRLALGKYDVTMDGIRAFQRFRFHCVPGQLQWPLPEKEWEDDNDAK